MRRFIVVAAGMLLLAHSLAAVAEEPVPTVTLSQSAPMPRLPEAEVGWRRVVAIGAGAILGVIAVNIMTGGMITPILAGASMALPADAVATAAAAPAVAAAPAAAASAAAPVAAANPATVVVAQAGIIAVAGAVGAAFGNWLYGTYGAQ